MMNKYKNLTKNTALFAISSFGTKLLSFFLVPLYTNMLTTEEYGAADILSTTTTLLIVILTINISDGVLVFAMDHKYKPEEILSFGLKVILGGWSVLIFGSAVLYLFHITAWPLYYYYFVIAYFAVSVFYQTLSNYLRAIDKVKDVAIAGMISGAAFICGNIAFLLVVNIGLNGYLISTVIGPLAGAIYCLIKIRIPVNILIKQSCDAPTRKALIKYCFPLVFNSMALWINSCLDRYFVTAICGVDQNGIYSIANKIPVILSTFYSVFSQAWTLSAIKEFDVEDKDGFFSNTYAVYNASMSLVCSGLILFNIPIAKIIYAKEFFIAWKYSSVLLIAILFNSLTAFTGSIFSATKQSNILAVTTVISAVINTVLNAVLIPLTGVLGAAIATAAALGTMWIIRIIYLRKVMNLKINWFSNIAAYILIFFQVIAEHTEKHGYMVQIIIFAAIVFIFRKYIQQIGTAFFKLIKFRKQNGG